MTARIYPEGGGRVARVLFHEEGSRGGIQDDDSNDDINNDSKNEDKNDSDNDSERRGVCDRNDQLCDTDNDASAAATAATATCSATTNDATNTPPTGTNNTNNTNSNTNNNANNTTIKSNATITTKSKLPDYPFTVQQALFVSELLYILRPLVYAWAIHYIRERKRNAIKNDIKTDINPNINNKNGHNNTNINGSNSNSSSSSSNKSDDNNENDKDGNDKERTYFASVQDFIPLILSLVRTSYFQLLRFLSWVQRDRQYYPLPY